MTDALGSRRRAPKVVFAMVVAEKASRLDVRESDWRGGAEQLSHGREV